MVLIIGISIYRVVFFLLLLLLSIFLIYCPVSYLDTYNICIPLLLCLCLFFWLYNHTNYFFFSSVNQSILLFHFDNDFDIYSFIKLTKSIYVWPQWQIRKSWSVIFDPLSFFSFCIEWMKLKLWPKEKKTWTWPFNLDDGGGRREMKGIHVNNELIVSACLSKCLCVCVCASGKKNRIRIKMMISSMKNFSYLNSIVIVV